MRARVRSSRAQVAATALCPLLTLVGCTIGPSNPARQPAPTPTPSFTTSYGLNASLIAAHIPDCTAVTAQHVAIGTAASNALISTCNLMHHKIVIYSWPDAASENEAASLLATSPASFSARGRGWTEILGDDATLNVQLSIANTVAEALHGSVAKYP